MRSLLFVPADSERKLEKALRGDADALILDLEDSVASSRRGVARGLARATLTDCKSPVGPRLIVRINALRSGLAQDDLDAVAAAAPFAVMLPKSVGGDDVAQLAAELTRRERAAGLDHGAIKVIVIATETGASMFGLGTYAAASPRLVAMTWGAEDLSADLGAETSLLPDGSYAPPYQLARSLLLYGAAAAAVDAVDGIHADFRDGEGLRTACKAARRDGFVAKLAIHPDQVAIINAAFTDSQDTIARAQIIVAAFEANPDAGVISIDGVMYDRPHLTRAQRILRRNSLSPTFRSGRTPSE